VYLFDDVDVSSNYYSCSKDGGPTKCWFAETLWRYAEGLTPKTVDIKPFLAENWALSPFHYEEERERVEKADLSYPIILSCDGRIMDGYHRLARAFLLGHTSLLVVQFTEDPPPDFEV